MVMMSLGLLAIITLAISYLSNRSLMQSKVLAETDEAFYSAQAALNLKIAELRAGDELQKDGQLTDSDAHYDVNVYVAADSVAEVPGYTVPADHYYVVAKGYDRDPALAGPKPREVVLGVLLRRSATAFTAAALAGGKLEVIDDGYTDTRDPATHNPGTHNLAHVGVFNPNAEINIAASSLIGDDGSGTGVADILLPTGFTGSVSAPTGSYANQTTSPFLTAPDPVLARSPGGSDLDTTSATIAPTLVGGEWVIKYNILKVYGNGTVRVDVSAVPDGETVFIDVNEFNLDKGTLEFFDDDVSGYGGGTASEVDVQVYAASKFTVTEGRFLTLNNEPRRMVAYCHEDMRLNKLSTSYFVGRSRTKVEVLEGSDIYGSILSDGEVIIKDPGSAVHYDENLQNVGGGATGGGSVVFVSFQRLR